MTILSPQHMTIPTNTVCHSQLIYCFIQAQHQHQIPRSSLTFELYFTHCSHHGCINPSIKFIPLIFTASIPNTSFIEGHSRPKQSQFAEHSNLCSLPNSPQLKIPSPLQLCKQHKSDTHSVNSCGELLHRKNSQKRSKQLFTKAM